jgi:hypothetical protein
LALFLRAFLRVFLCGFLGSFFLCCHLILHSEMKVSWIGIRTQGTSTLIRLAQEGSAVAGLKDPADSRLAR